MLEEMKNNAQKVVDIYLGSLTKNDLAGCNRAEERVKDLLKDYNKQSLNETLYALKQKDDPMTAAAAMMRYDTLKFRHDKVKGVEVGAHLEPSSEYLNLVEVARNCGKGTLWQYELEKFAQLLAVRISEDLNLGNDARTLSENARIKEKYRMSEKGRAIEDGDDPTTDENLIARLQKIVDAVFTGTGLSVGAKELAFIRHGFDKLDTRKARTIDAGTVKLMHNLFLQVSNAMIGDGTYDVKIKEKKVKAETPAEDKKPEDKPAETAPVAAAPAAEKKARKSKKAA